jgi:hypothetical protein
MNCELPVWQPNGKFKRGKHFASLFVASRNCGKSYLARYLLKYHLRDKFDMFVIFCNSREDLEEYQEIFPTELAFALYKPEVLKSLAEKNQERERKGQKQINFLVLIDDNVSKSVKNCPILMDVYCTGRHNGISIIFISQLLTANGVSWRANSDFTFVLKQNSAQQREIIRDNVLRGLIDFDGDFSRAQEKRALDHIIKRYLSEKGNVLVVDCSGKNDQVCFFRAPDKLERKKNSSSSEEE